jgi:hypothetical protein
MRLIRTLLLLLFLGLLMPGPGHAIEIQNETFVFPSVPYEFSTVSNTFSGEGGGGLPISQIGGQGSITAHFDNLGTFLADPSTFEPQTITY